MANFTIVEAANALYFTITDVRVITSYTIKIQSGAMSDVTEKTLILTAGQIGDLAAGLVLDPSDFGYSDELFSDGLYVFKTTKDSGDDFGAEETYTVGFANIITGEVMRNALEYRTDLDIKTKDWIEEQNIFLINLDYAAQVGSTTHYLENLNALESIQ